jgi:hypothetical protein
VKSKKIVEKIGKTGGKLEKIVIELIRIESIRGKGGGIRFKCMKFIRK